MRVPLPLYISPSPSVLASHLQNETVLLDVEREHYFSLKDVGHRFWCLIEKDPSTDHAISKILVEYDVDEAVLRNDLERLCQMLSVNRLAVFQDQAR